FQFNISRLVNADRTGAGFAGTEICSWPQRACPESTDAVRSADKELFHIRQRKRVVAGVAAVPVAVSIAITYNNSVGPLRFGAQFSVITKIIFQTDILRKSSAEQFFPISVLHIRTGNQAY